MWVSLTGCDTVLRGTWQQPRNKEVALGCLDVRRLRSSGVAGVVLSMGGQNTTTASQLVRVCKVSGPPLYIGPPGPLC
jgi:hypothetical protein